MAMSGGRDDGEPMMEMNTTPLIDVMLVLLIMFIITIPIQTHAVKVDLPQNSNNPAPVVEPQKNKLYIDANGNVFWNSQQIDDVRLRQYLDASLQQDPEPELHFQPDPNARYDVVDRVLAIVKRANVTKLGFVGNEQYRNDF
ncbi:biopolymer transporter ExbD [Sphingomonas psychrotolerans]|uniref:Biopolymer transporter ExbD n=1 Tax=Sphingomonas psychrotolerans TaxID=1327635 RepID=A0ABU3N177_9SPHN|nr:biopolymer transporter ExbD [Sphingomonas psychrotolerans]MDT8757517.1 biopolymer transporter ExbD [Sphingomonas psychrotolerans]